MHGRVGFGPPCAKCFPLVSSCGMGSMKFLMCGDKRNSGEEWHQGFLRAQGSYAGRPGIGSGS